MIPTGIIPTKKKLCSYVATLFRFVASFACVGILNFEPDGSREILVIVIVVIPIVKLLELLQLLVIPVVVIPVCTVMLCIAPPGQ